MKRGFKIFAMVVLGVLAVAAFIYFTQWLWNNLVPELFNGPVLTYLQTAGLLLLSKILFTGFGGKCKCHGNSGGGPWKAYWKAKWSGMSEEEKEKLKQRMKDKWCSPFPESADEKASNSND
jgi:hypothetical protein